MALLAHLGLRLESAQPLERAVDYGPGLHSPALVDPAECDVHQQVETRKLLPHFGAPQNSASPRIGSKDFTRNRGTVESRIRSKGTSRNRSAGVLGSPAERPRA
ncbi:hypothetical protein ASF53_13360 [Methylobacterium sp. Leaf123]|nr:hypothetical protein ASF53_13360 [Methylobacterium sp. Leaf123]